MPNYTSLQTQIDAVKSEITASLAASVYNAQDLVFVASALKTLGGMLGVDDIVQATADAQDSLNELVSDILDGTAPAVAGLLYIGSAPQAWETTADLTNAVAVFRKDTGTNDSSFAQIAFNNDDPTSSTDIIVYSSNGNDTTGWTGIGMTGNAFDDATYGITGPHDGYVFTSALEPITRTITNKGLANNVATITTSAPHGFTIGKTVEITGVDATFNGKHVITGTPSDTTFTYAKTASPVGSTASGGNAKMFYGKGNLVLATADTGYENAIIIAAGGYSSGNTQVKIIPDLTVHVDIPTPSVSPTTGAVTVKGGVGIEGDLNIAGDVNINGTISFAGGGTTVVSENLAVTDPAIFVANENTGNLVDFSFVGEYQVGGNVRYAAFSKDASEGVWKLASNITTEPATTINYAEAGLVYDRLQLDQVIINSAPTIDTHAATKKYVDDQEWNNTVLSLALAI